MNFRNSITLFVAFMGIGMGIYVLAQNGIYPVAIVNSDIITRVSIEKGFSAAYTYYQNALLVYGKDPNELKAPESMMEIRRATLDKLVVDSLVFKELKKRVGSREYTAIAEKNIQNVLDDNQGIQDASKKLYGLDFPDFKQMVLEPQAYREILQGRMFLGNENFDEWLKKAREDALVIILSPSLKWEGNQVKF